MRHAVLPLLALVLALGLAGCGDDDAADPGTGAGTPGPLDGQTWVATSVTEDGEERPLVEDSELWLTFGGGRMGIQAGCNTMSGPYTLEDGTLETGDLAATEIGCPDDLAEQDAWLVDLFASEVEVDRGEERLTLADDGTTIELAPREVVSPDASLTDTTWELVAITRGNGPDATASNVPRDVTARLRINGDGSVEVDTGCSTGVGAAEIDGSAIVFQSLGVSEEACPGRAARTVEEAVLAGLQGRVEHEISDQQLTLTDAGTDADTDPGGALVWRAVDDGDPDS